MDFGTKRNIINNLVKRNCIVTVYPSFTSADEIIKTSPDGIMLSNGPGDPSECVDIIKEIKKLYDYGIPTFAICLGHQLMGTCQRRRDRKNEVRSQGRKSPGQIS